MAQNRGELFEDQFKASMPPEVEVRKLATPGPRAQSMAQIMDMLTRLARQACEEVPGWALQALGAATHTPKQPYDMLLLAPIAPSEARFGTWWRTYLRGLGVGGALDVGEEECVREHDAAWAGFQAAFTTLGARPRLVFALELKSAGSSKSLPFDRLKDHQEEGLSKAAARGSVAGLVVEFPDVEPAGEVFFIPIGSYVALKRECGRKSLSLEAARSMGQLIELDPDRGRSRRYWKVAEWLRLYGADVPPTAER